MRLGSTISSIILLSVCACQRQGGVPEASGRLVESVPVGNLTVSGPYTYENLSVYLIHGKDPLPGKEFLTLEEALEKKQAIVHETGDVNELAIENLSDQELFVQSGDIVRGGKQDRVFANDLVVAPKSGKVPIASFCVEQGRWTQRGEEYEGFFASSDNFAASKGLKLASKLASDQGQVWKEVSATQVALADNIGGDVTAEISQTSLELTLANDSVQEASKDYTKALSPVLANKKSAIGFAFAIGGEINSADIYANTALFRKLWPKMLQAAAVEAVSQKTERSGSPPELGVIQTWIEQVGTGKLVEKKVSTRTHLYERETEADVFFETRDAATHGAWLHRNYIRK